MKLLKKFLSFVVGIFFTIIIVLLAIVSFSLLVYPLEVYLSVLITVVLTFVLSYYSNILRRKMFRLGHGRKPVYAIVLTSLITVAMVSVFLIPSRTHESTHSPVDTYGIKPEYIKNHDGDKIAVYIHKPDKPNNLAPILFINGGPGGSPGKSNKDYLDGYMKLGYVVYAFDPIGTGYSPMPKSNSSFTIADEVENVSDILKHYNIPKVNLIAHSYGGNVASRFIEKYTDKVNAYLAVDTAPIYSMHENYPSEEQDSKFQKTVETTRENTADIKSAQSVLDFSSLREMIRIGYGGGLMQKLGKNDVPYGDYSEYDYIVSLLASVTSGDAPKDGKIEKHLYFISNQLITKSLSESPDFTKGLKKKNTPPVLVIHPEFGVVPWQVHYRYKEFFKNVKFVTVPEAVHRVWKSKLGRETLLQDGDLFFRNEPLSDEYTSKENPFPPIK
ncbi:alpha/beta fold hydrolase (plasmid) [Bacillus mycoides]|uniref:alpha/beta fold hydrolase n=1 Tax=Bacillus mycoides TaxID=1405 RepID=UPI001C0214F2|nr:alpha/beta fold hydrolase [Bacillus mycoides]QWH15311.1 alpha/beta fold hydrolase [Bacillus mycoides]